MDLCYLKQVKVALRNRSRQAASLDMDKDAMARQTDSRLPMQAAALQGYDEMHSVGGKKVEFALFEDPFSLLYHYTSYTHLHLLCRISYSTAPTTQAQNQLHHHINIPLERSTGDRGEYRQPQSTH